MAEVNRRWVLVEQSDSRPHAGLWRLEETAPQTPRPGEVLVRSIYLSVDPYMRGRIAKARSYARAVQPGEVMVGGGVGEVSVSRHPGLAPGDLIESFDVGWQTHAVIAGARARKLDPAQGPLHAALSYLGLPGLTAWLALFDQARPRPGETVVISAAAGAVGQIAGQLAKAAGCRAVAIAGSPEKLAWCRELGYDAAIDHRAGADLPAAIGEACPDGVDVFFDNTAGPIQDAVMPHLAIGARVIVCGTIALADRIGQPDIGPRFSRQILISRATVQGFLLFDHAPRHEHARMRLAKLATAGHLRHREDMLDGIERMPEAFLRLLDGRNLGKQLVRVGRLPEGVAA